MRKEKEENASGREVQVLSSLDSVSTDDFFWLGCGDKLIDYGSESCCASFQCGEYLSYCWDESACVFLYDWPGGRVFDTSSSLHLY